MPARRSLLLGMISILLGGPRANGIVRVMFVQAVRGASILARASAGLKAVGAVRLFSCYPSDHVLDGMHPPMDGDEDNTIQ